jgi:FtsH-binding integral membrane protein
MLLPSLQGYMGKHEIQTTFILILAITGIVATMWLTINIRRYTWSRILMLAGTWGVLCMCVIEMISPHNIDAFIYSIDGVFLRSGLIYFALSLVTAFGAIYFRKGTADRS